MKAYRLIKKYPGSPKLGTIVEDKNGSLYFPETNSVESSSKGNLFKEIVINNPEFWQEVIEKDYEILSIYSGNTILNDSNVKTWEKFKVFRGAWNIHSAKRLSDGEIFTVGDKCKDVNTNCTTKVSEITLKNTICFINGVNINWLEKVKQPLFTTEDGVDIYERDKYFEANLTYGVKSWTTEYPVYFNKDISKRIFSTKEKAEEYILMNKPCLSISDVLKLKNKWSIKTIDKLKELVKNK